MSSQEFPVDGILPKRSTEAAAFVAQQPGCDGRDVLVAILDTGVDPGAAGLQKTSTGAKKMVGLLDPSGSGDVEMQALRCGKDCEAGTEEDGTQDCFKVKGVSGRTLILPKALDNPSGEWRVGLKAVMQLFPGGLQRRAKKEASNKWEDLHVKALAEARERLDDFDEENHVDRTAKKSALERAKLVERNELKARVDYLEKSESKSFSEGNMIDCVTFKSSDGVCRALVDRSGTGDLRNTRPLRSFAAFEDENGFEFDKWDEATQLNFAVNIFQDGKLLSIVVDSGAHGTHVASIVGGFHGEGSELNGVAPGVQLVSMKIGDGRLDGMETAASIIRSLNACVELGVDVINMSFGEPTTLPEMGRIAELARELVENHGVVFVSSAGNAGPALSTLGAPGATTSSLIGVGAYVEPEMMLAAYSLKHGEGPPPKGYTWTSRGPRYDGGMGVTICAPGGAIAAVPEWCLLQKRLMNGTSMSSPNAAGCISLLISAMRKQGKKFAPWTIKRAIENSAIPIEGTEVHAQGCGLIQVVKAFEILREVLPGIHFEVPYRISVSGNECRTDAGPACGIYLREPWETRGKSEFNVSVEPIFCTENPDVSPVVSDDMNENRKRHLGSFLRHEQKERNSFEARIHLQATQPWIRVTPFIMMNAGPKNIKVEVDPTALSTSADGNHQVHFAEVLGFDPAANPGLGPIFRVPVTVIKPESCDVDLQDSVAPAASIGRLRPAAIKTYKAVPFKPGHVVRHFISVPAGATWLDIVLRPTANAPTTVPEGSTRTFFLHLLQMSQQSNYRDDELSIAVGLRQDPAVASSRAMAVNELGTVEVCIAQYWSSLGEGPLDIEVRFSGITPNPSKLVLGGQSGGVTRVEVRTDLASARLVPAAKLKTWAQNLRPDASKTQIQLMPRGYRDWILGHQSRPTYGLMLQYSFKQVESGKLTPRLPLLDQTLYDAPVDSQMCMLFDSNKKLLNTSDAWPRSVEIPKGTITARVMVRHERTAVLERLKEMPMVIERTLGTEISLKVHKTHPGAVQGKSEFQAKRITCGEKCAVFFSLPQYKDMSKSLPKNLKAGDMLLGTVTYGKRNSRDTGVIGTDKRPDGFPVEVVMMPPPSSPPDGPSLKDSADEKAATNAVESQEEEKTDDGVLTEDEEGKGKDEEASPKTVTRVIYQSTVIPQLKANTKGLEELASKTDAAFDRIFKDLLNQSVRAIEDAKGKFLEDDQKEELESLEISIARTELLRAAKKSSKHLKARDGDDESLQELAQLCDKFISSLEPDSLLLALSRFKSSGDLDDVGQTEKQKEASKKASEKRSWLVEAIVLKSYSTRFASNSDLEDLLAKFADSKDLCVSQLKFDRHRHFGRYASAIKVLDEKLTEPGVALEALPMPLTEKEVQHLKKDLLESLGWHHLARDQTQKILHAFPPGYPPF